ncbi:MAG: phage portal protein, partial [Ruminococcus sp.]|nr:phage portal protein [Ruminococcus sp.]
MSIFSSMFKARDKPKDSTAGSAWMFRFGGSSSNKLVTERSSMQVTAVYACVRVLSEAVAQILLHLYKYTGDGSKDKRCDREWQKADEEEA